MTPQQIIDALKVIDPQTVIAAGVTVAGIINALIAAQS